MVQNDDVDELTRTVVKKTVKTKTEKRKKQVAHETVPQIVDTVQNHPQKVDIAQRYGNDDLADAFKTMEQNYNELRNIGIKEADERFDMFKAASDAQINGL